MGRTPDGYFERRYSGQWLYSWVWQCCQPGHSAALHRRGMPAKVVKENVVWAAHDEADYQKYFPLTLENAADFYRQTKTKDNYEKSQNQKVLLRG